MSKRTAKETPDSSAAARHGVTKGRDRTRELLLNTAGEIFAEKGREGATSREICDRAGVNVAAVNYHFGGIEALYGATVAEAHQCIMRLEALEATAVGELDPAAQLRSFIRTAVTRLVQPLAKSWQLRLLAREIASSSPTPHRGIDRHLLPKSRVLRGIVANLICRRPDDQAVSRALLTVVAPLLTLALADRRALVIMMPLLKEADSEVEPLTRHIERFILAGLAAMAETPATK